MTVTFARLTPTAQIPSYAHPGDAGMDLCADETRTLAPGERAAISTGLTLQLPPQTEAQVRPRSGMALKFGVTVLNTPGTIDEGYRGEIKVILINHSQTPFDITPGMRIAQLVIASVLRVNITQAETLSADTARGTGGFGSSGYYQKGE